MANEKRQVLVLTKSPLFTTNLGDQFLCQFDLLKSWESNLPLHQFLAIHARSVQALIASFGTLVNADLLRQLPALKLVVTASTAVNQVDLAECGRRRIAVANAGTVYSEDVADLAVGLLIDVLRKISAGDRFVKQGLWPVHREFSLGSKIGGKRVGIVGLGSIGLEVAKRLEAFGCRISYYSRKKKSYVHYPFYSNVIELAADSGVLIVCCALTDQTHHMINKLVMLALGKEGVIVNVSRGSVVDEEEIVRCLVEGKLGGAGLDVFENEPDVPEELLKLDNVVLSPHAASFTPESFTALGEVVAGNLEAFFSNEPLLSPVKEGMFA